MKLLFKPRDEKHLGEGDLPFGTFDDTSNWLPITRYLEMGAERIPRKILFKVANNDGILKEQYTYEQTNEWSNRIANGLFSKHEIKKGDKVGIYMLNCSEYIFSILAIHKVGGIQVPINKDEKGQRLCYIINYSEMKALIVDKSSLPFIEEISDQLQNLKLVIITGESDNIPSKVGSIPCVSFSNFNKFSKFNHNQSVKVSDVERCMFTSGTTGMPKGVLREHGGVILTVRAYLQQHGIRSGDTLMSVLTLAHANAQVMCLFASIGAGATAVFYPRFSASNFWKWAYECGATVTNMLGSVAEYLWSAPESEWDSKHKVRTVLSGPAPKNLEEFQNRFNTRTIDGYGSTEMGMVLWKDPEDHRPGSSGYPMQGYYVELRNPLNQNKIISPLWDSTDDQTPPDEAKGLLYIRPLIPHTTLNEYFKDEKRTKEAFDEEGFFNSDDLFARAMDGRYYFVGRYSRIRVSGENVDPVAVANEATEYEPIYEAIAVGLRLPNVADDEIKLNITLKSGAAFDPVEFCKWMAERVIVAMVPRFIEVYENGFPLTATQKVRVVELKELSDKTWDRNESGLKFSARK